MSVLKIKKDDGTWVSIGSGIDATLTQEGQAADAKAVGDKLDSLTNIIVQADEPIDAEDGTLWIDTDEDGMSESTVIVDASLTQSGYAADAKVTGDFIDNLSSEIDNIISVPSCTTSDNGKFLRVVNGIAAWQTIQNAEEVSV